MKRAAVKADEEDEGDEEDEADGGSKISSFVAGTFNNVSSVAQVRVARVYIFPYRRSQEQWWRLLGRRNISDCNRALKCCH